MNLITGHDLFSSEYGRADVILVTTNSVVTNGRLVMGKGAAKQAAALFPTLPAVFGETVIRYDAVGRVYGTFVAVGPPLPAASSGLYPAQTRFGAFQAKVHWRDPAQLVLISHSAGMLAELAGRMPNWRFAVNFPGSGAGGLDEADIAPILEVLPNNVWVYRR